MQIPVHYTVLFLSAAAAAVLCIAAEFKKSKKADLKLDGKMCSLPQSSAAGLGIAAVIALLTGHIAANFFACRELRSSVAGGGGCAFRKKAAAPCALLVLSWMSFLIAITLLSVGTSMNGRQVVGEGWLEGECYLVKNGVYGASAFLGLLALGSAIGSAAVAGRRHGEIEEIVTVSNNK